MSEPVSQLRPTPSNEIEVRLYVDGQESESVRLDLNLENLTMRESVRLERLLGEELMGRLLSGKINESELARPSLIQALLFVKIKTQYPELEIDQFDVDYDELVNLFGDTPGKPSGPSKG